MVENTRGAAVNARWFFCYDTPRAVFPLIVDVCGDSTGAVFVQGDMPVVVASGALGQTAQKTVEIPPVAVLGQGRADFLSWCRGRFPMVQTVVGPTGFPCCWTKWSRSLLCRSCSFPGVVQTCRILWRFPLVQFLVTAFMPVLGASGAVCQTAQKLWSPAVAVHRRSSTSFRCRRDSSPWSRFRKTIEIPHAFSFSLLTVAPWKRSVAGISSVAVCCLVVDAPVMQVVSMPVVFRQARTVQTLLNSVEVPQLQFLHGYGRPFVPAATLGCDSLVPRTQFIAVALVHGRHLGGDEG